MQLQEPLPRSLTPPLDEKAILFLAQELTGSEENARSFLLCFKTPVDTFNSFFSEDVQNKIVTALGSAYSMMQIGCPERYTDHVLAGGEFTSFAGLLAQCYQDVGVSSRCPCVCTNMNFMSDILKSGQHSARTKALALEKQFMRFFKDYALSPVGIGEVSGKHQFMGKEVMTPFLSYMIIFFLMNPLTPAKRDEIILQLATRLGKAKTDITIEDMLKNKKFMHDQINTATGAKTSFSYESWSKAGMKNTQTAFRALRNPRRSSRDRNNTRRRSRSRERGQQQQQQRGRTPPA